MNKFFKRLIFISLFLVGWFLLSSFFISVDSKAADSFFGPVGNRVNLTYKIISANTLIKGTGGEIWRLDFQSTASNGTFTICDSTTIQSCSTAGLGIMSEGSQSVSGNSYSIDYGNRPIQTSVGIFAIVTNGTLIISYD